MARNHQGAVQAPPPPAEKSVSVHGVLDDEVADVLRGTFFAPEVPIEESTGAGRTRTGRRPAARATALPAKPKPDHYKVICISMYTEDLDRLDEAVRELKRRGYTRASRSSVLRAAMLQLDLARVPKGL